MNNKFKIGVLLFPEFELLDVFGPLEMYGIRPEVFEICMVSQNIGNVVSKQGPKVVAEYDFNSSDYDIIMIPGGMGTRKEVENPKILEWIQIQSKDAKYITSICTGSALLAKSGLLNGVHATTNKRAFNWVISQGSQVLWKKEARWVEDGRYFTSSGISAGMDMTLGLISKILGTQEALAIANEVEYEWHSDPSWDPFAKLYG
ncbi:DJ-1/PfpI family protein [Sulfurimonas microaerophilic]|uniref:DJ-1/PfpI family protein n=1 Tax=Sulfurimonas microaerophilic TaxID=3058392 RepID=UPI002715131B|nr:DJ-1/PfpI family protein [Sulfurimonas sp. hsl 1-7]